MGPVKKGKIGMGPLKRDLQKGKDRDGAFKKAMLLLVP